MLIPDGRESRRALGIEFKTFAPRFLAIPCQILRAGRRLVSRILSYNEHLETFLQTFKRIRALALT